MRKFRCLWWLLLAPYPASAELTLFADAEVWGFAEPVPVYHYAKDWQARLSGGADGFLYERDRFGFRWRQFEFARIAQRVYEVEPSRDTARLYHRIENDLPFTAGERFALDLKLRHVAMHGIQFGRRFVGAQDRLTVQPAVNLWKANSLLHGRIVGAARATSSDEFDYSLAIDYFYTEDRLLDRRVARPEGRGASFDLALKYQLGERWHARVQAYDLWSRLQWNDAPFTVGNAQSDTREFDDDGFVHFNPTFSGREGNRDFRQRLPRRGSLALGYHHGAAMFEAAVRVTPLRSFPLVSATWRLRGDLAVGVDAFPSESAFGLRLHWKGLSLSYVSDATNYRDAHYTSLNLGFKWTPPLRQRPATESRLTGPTAHIRTTRDNHGRQATHTGDRRQSAKRVL